MFITLSQDAQERFRLAEPSSRANFISHPSKKAQNAWATKTKAHTTLPAKAAPISPTQGPAAPGPFPTQLHVTRGPSATQALQRGTETPVPLCASPLRTETHHPWKGRQILGLGTHLPSLGSRLWAQPKPSVPPAPSSCWRLQMKCCPTPNPTMTCLDSPPQSPTKPKWPSPSSHHQPQGGLSFLTPKVQTRGRWRVAMPLSFVQTTITAPDKLLLLSKHLRATSRHCC